jgi:hypothetical protein
MDLIPDDAIGVIKPKTLKTDNQGKTNNYTGECTKNVLGYFLIEL